MSKCIKSISRSFGFIFIHLSITFFLLAFFTNLTLQNNNILKEEYDGGVY